ncbi:MAG: restriction endonuclease fold toxin-2 domain-containing protein [Acidimicrobiales bacterium]
MGRGERDGASVGIAPFLEETLKLAPLVVVAVTAPGRVRRFAAVDWAVAGLTCGAAFAAVEEASRAVLIWTTRDDVFAQLFGLAKDQGVEGFWLNPLTATRSSVHGGLAVSPGHQVWTALATATLALAIALWRSGAGGRAGRRLAAPVLAVTGLVVAVADHAGFNATVANPRWTAVDDSGVPGVLRMVWALSGKGHRTALLAGMALGACLLVDVARRARAARITGVLAGRAVVAGRWDAAPPAPPAPGRPDGGQRAFDLVGQALTQWTGDLAAVVSAHARGRGESRRAAWQRGRAAAGLTRGLREEAMWATTPGAEPAARHRAAVAAAVVGLGLLAAAVVAGVSVASAVGDTMGDANLLFGYLAGLFEGLAEWWAGLGWGGQIAVGAAFAALVVLSGGSLGLGFGLSGVATYAAGEGHGVATFARDPAAATRAYLATATPQGLLLDAGEALLTFAPSNFAGAAVGRGVRNAVADYADDPAAFWAARQASLGAEAGVVDPGAFVRREPIELADGTVHEAVHDGGRQLDQWVDARPTEPVKASGDAATYQRQVYGDDERLVGPGTWADGRTSAYGAIGDAKLVLEGRSWYNPTSMGNPQLAEFATRDIRGRLVKYRAVLDDPSNPVKVLKIVTNDPAAAGFFEAQMRDLGVPGYVRLEPKVP